MLTSRNKKIISLTIFLVILSFSFFINLKEANASLCFVKSAVFHPHAPKDKPLVDSWYSANNKNVRIEIDTEGCTGKQIEVVLKAHFGGLFNTGADQVELAKNVLVQAHSFNISLIAGESKCDMGESPDCQYYLKISPPAGEGEEYISDGKDENGAGNLSYNCDGPCNDQWRLVDVSTTDPLLSTTDPLLTATTTKPTLEKNETARIVATLSDGASGKMIGFSNGGGVLSNPSTACPGTELCCKTSSGGICTIDFSSAAGGDYRVGVSASGYTHIGNLSIHVISDTEGTGTETQYWPLAPLPGVGQPCDTLPGTDLNTCIDTTPEGGGFGNYLNVMIKLFIGLCAVLAMVMIVMGGIEYMTSGLISGKEHGKETITHAILGLLLALGAYAILFTINPDLLKQI